MGKNLWLIRLIQINNQTYFQQLQLGLVQLLVVAGFYAAKYAGPISILSWIIGATLSLMLAFLLAEVATMYQETGLFSRLLTITHNRDYGFIVASSNWFSMVSSIFYKCHHIIGGIF